MNFPIFWLPPIDTIYFSFLSEQVNKQLDKPIYRSINYNRLVKARQLLKDQHSSSQLKNSLFSGFFG